LCLERLSETGIWGGREVVNARGNGTLVGEESRYAALVLDTGFANEGRVVDDSVFGGLALGLEGAKQGLLSTQDLNS